MTKDERIIIFLILFPAGLWPCNLMKTDNKRELERRTGYWAVSQEGMGFHRTQLIFFLFKGVLYEDLYFWLFPPASGDYKIGNGGHLTHLSSSTSWSLPRACGGSQRLRDKR
jgi:hypothetical protein